MSNKMKFSSLQTAGLLALRFLVGWHLLYEGIAKLYSPNWSSSGFLEESQWILSGFANWIVSNEEVLQTVDFLNIWGLMAIGLGLILGLLTRYASVAGMILLLLYYFNSPPLIGMEYSIPSEGNYLIVNKTLIETGALFILYLFPTSHKYGLDYFIDNLRNKKNNHEGTK